jgi:hypothetical protein
MVDISNASLADRSDEDIEAAEDLNKGSSIDIESIILDSAQKSMEESKVKIEKTAMPKEEKSTIDYQVFSLPEKRDEYLAHVNEVNRRVYKEEIVSSKEGLILHLFSVVTDVI